MIPRTEKDNGMTGRLFLTPCMGDRFHSVRVTSQYKEILENELEMCGFFATVTNSNIGGLQARYFLLELALRVSLMHRDDYWRLSINGAVFSRPFVREDTELNYLIPAWILLNQVAKGERQGVQTR